MVRNDAPGSGQAPPDHQVPETVPPSRHYDEKEEEMNYENAWHGGICLSMHVLWRIHGQDERCLSVLWWGGVDHHTEERSERVG